MDYSKLLESLSSLIPRLAFGFAAIVIFALLIWLLRRLSRIIHLLRQNSVYLELTPPAFNDRLPEATNQLFGALHGLGASRQWLDRLLMRESSLALEIVSTRKDGIRYLIRVAIDQAETLKQLTAAYLPEAKVRNVRDYLSDFQDIEKSKVIEFKQKAHFALPFQSFEQLKSHDPMAYVTGAMTKLKDDELMAFQLVMTPVKVKAAEIISHKILSNEDLMPILAKKNSSFFSVILGGINSILFGLLDAAGQAYHGTMKGEYFGSQKELEYKKQIAKKLKPVRTLSYFEHELVESIQQKVSQQMFRADIRILILSRNEEVFHQRNASIRSAFSLFTVTKYQALKAKRKKYGILARYLRFLYKRRLPAILPSHSNILAVSEGSSLYHFPNSVTAKTENVIKSLSRTLPAPVSLKNNTKPDILLGVNRHHGSETPIGLTEQERERHVYIIGGTGNGKTTMLLYGIVQDIKNGKGIAVLDPHGDLAETILRYIPEDRIKDVIYMNPDDLSFPIGINLLELPEGLTGDELVREKDLVTESTISVMRKMFSDDDSGGHRIEYVLRNTIQTALTLEGSTLFTIFRLLNDIKFRKTVVKNLEDNDLKIFWQNELGKAGDMQKVKMAAGITSKIGRFLFSASAKRILEQEKSTIDFDDILNSSKILVCNFSKGLLGEDTSTLFGTTVLAKLQMASLRRARIKQTDRQPFYLYVDEFQNFATMSFVQMLSEARKYKLFLTMAEQSTSQQDYQRLVEVILANVGTLLCFRSGSPADERLVLPLFSPFIESGEIANLPAYNFYLRIAAVKAQEPMSGSTVLLGNEGDVRIANQVVEYSRSKYAMKYQHQQEKEQPDTKTSKQDKGQIKKSRNIKNRYSEQRAGEAALMDA